MEEPGDRIVRIAVANETLRLTCRTLHGDVEVSFLLCMIRKYVGELHLWLHQLLNAFDAIFQLEVFERNLETSSHFDIDLPHAAIP